MNLKQILNAVLARSVFLQKDSFALSVDPDDVQMMAIANEVISEYRDFYPWSRLSETFDLDLTLDTVYDLPEDYLSVTPDSAWETDGSRKVDLPVPRNRWFMYKYSSLTDAGTVRARLYGNTIEINEPGLASEISLEYVSKYTVLDSDGNPKEYFTADSDTFKLDDDTLIKGIQGYWAEAKMMPQADRWLQRFNKGMTAQIGIDNSAQTIGGIGRGMDRRSPYYPLWRTSNS